MVYGKRTKQAELNRTENSPNRQTGIANRSLARLIGIMAVVLLVGNSALAEFIVQPMTFRRQVQPGRRIPLEFRLENISGDTSETLSLRLADLTQDENGTWTHVDDAMDRSGMRSCREWINLPVTSMEVGPYQAAPLVLEARIPPQTRGYYFAALIVETAPRETEIDGMMTLFTVQYLVPIILEIQSVPLRHEVQLTDVHLSYIPPTVEVPTAAVEVGINISNTGGTYSRIVGHVRVFQHIRGRWQQVVDHVVPEIGIIPGVRLNLKEDIGILLADGTYRVEGFLYVDSQRGNAIQKEIEFKGDPLAVAGRGFVPIDVDQEELFIDVMPGASRFGSIQVANGSEETIEIHAELRLPGHMLNAVSGSGIRGDELSFVDWATVQPDRFTLRRYGRRPVRLSVRMPNVPTAHAHYYGLLKLHATYPDGSVAGTREVRVCLNNTAQTGQHDLQGITFTLAEAGPSRYFATAWFTNQGVTHVRPRCRGYLTLPGGGVWKQFLMSSEAYGQRGVLLPLETRQFTGILDVSDVAPDVYRLYAVVEVPGGADVQSQIIIEVLDQDGQRVAQVVGFDRVDGGRQPIQLQ